MYAPNPPFPMPSRRRDPGPRRPPFARTAANGSRWLLVVLLCLLVAGGAESVAAGSAADGRLIRTVDACAAPPATGAKRETGRMGLQLGAGSVNGLRFGPRYTLHPRITLEADAGYVRITLVEETGTDYTDGWSVSAGGNWYMLPEADVSPLLALTVAYTASTALPRGGQQRRVAIIPSLGSEYFMLPGFSLFFRFGPAFQLTDDRGESRFETLAQFDAGLAYIF